MTAVDFLQSLLSAMPGSVAAMPLPGDFPIDNDQIRTFGLSGDFGVRRLSTGLEIEAGAMGAMPIQAMFEGELTLVGAKNAFDPIRPDGTSFVTSRAGLVLKVVPITAVRRAMSGEPDYPLELPTPRWVVYEGVTPNEDLLEQGGFDRYEVLDAFPFDSDELPPGHEALLDDLVADMLLDMGLRVRLDGYTDAEGDVDHNLDLGRRRAMALKDYLSNHGIDPQRLKVNTFGEAAPLNPDAIDRDAAAVNRRVEIHLFSRIDLQVKAGVEIGTAPDGVTITVLDQYGYYLDPLDLALRLRPDLDTHWLASHRDPLSPMVASGSVRCVSLDPANDGSVDGSGTFSFHSSLDEALAGADEADTVWVCTGLAPASVDLGRPYGLTINRPLSIVGKPATDGALPRLVRSEDGDALVKVVEPISAPELGVRILGLSWAGGATEGAAIAAEDSKNLHIGNCDFKGFNSDDDGGAITLDNCKKVLVESSSFRLNRAHKGGAIFAEDCQELVITGAPCPGIDALLASEELLPAIFLPATIPGQVAGVPEALGGFGFESIFVDQSAEEGGGAIALRNCSFRISHCYFSGNGGGSYGGGIGIQLFDSELEEIESSVERCVFAQNSGTVGGGICAMGSNDDDAALAGFPHTLYGGGRVRIEKNAFQSNSGTRSGAGLHLLTGYYLVIGNRIAQNSAANNGGGLSCIGRCNAVLDGNLVLANNITRQAILESPGGGAGIYATFFTGEEQTTLTLRRNRIIANESTENGGGLRATCGTRVILESDNLFKDNVAYLNGGGISTNQAHLTICPGNRFETNKTRPGPPNYYQGGSGGAIHCAGDLPSISTVQNVVYGPCAADGSGIDISGSIGNKVTFTGNEAVQHGAAIYVFQQIDMTLPQWIGTLRRVVIQNADFDSNNSQAELIVGGQPLSGSTLVLDGLTRWQHLLNHAFGDFYVLRDLNLTLGDGVGVYLIDSAEVERTNVTVQPAPGAGPIANEFIVNR